jgi:hypothetical protein
MCYIHGSELGVHGKLRSANCLIDGRFVLKISDFGLHTLTTPSEVPRDATFYTSKLRKYMINCSLWKGIWQISYFNKALSALDLRNTNVSRG